MAQSPGRAHRLPQKVDGGRLINIVGNAVPGVPQVHSTCKPYRMATFGGRNAEDGVPYAPNSLRRDTSPEVSAMPHHVTRTPREGCPYSLNTIRPRIPYAERIPATGRAVSARLTACTIYQSRVCQRRLAALPGGSA